MKLYDFLKCVELDTNLTIASYKNDKILIYEKIAHTPKGNLKKVFKQLQNKTIIFLYAYDNKKIKLFIE